MSSFAPFAHAVHNRLTDLSKHDFIDLVDVGMIAFVILLTWAYSPDT